MTFSTKSDKAFSQSGFNNWKKASERFTKHESSQSHSEAYLKVTSKMNVACMLESARIQVQTMRQRMLLKQLSSLKYLVHQGLAIRGHSEIEGNLVQLMKLCAEDDGELNKWLSDGNYLSPAIVNEQIKLMADSLLRDLLCEIRSAPWFAIIADEATDIRYNEQMSIVIRWVDESYEVFEEPLGLIQVPKTDSSTLTDAIKDVLLRCVLPLNQCRGQTYDGASNMSGHLTGVATRIKSVEPRALHVHCLAHCLNLCLQDATRICVPIRDCLELIKELVKLIKFSPKRAHLFETLKKQLSPESADLRPLCPTRWTVGTYAIKALLDNYQTLCTTLEEVHATGRDEYAMKAGGFLSQLEKFSTFFSLKLAYLVFGPAEQLSYTLQGKTTNIQEAKQAAKLAESFFRSQRTDASFSRFYESAVKESQSLTEEPVLPRCRKLPRRIDDGANSNRFLTPCDYYRKLYFEVLDIICNEVSRRFHQEDFDVVLDIEKTLIGAGNGEVVVIPNTVLTKYRDDLNMDRLLTHLKMVPDIVKRYSCESGITIKKITNVSTLCDIMNNLRPGVKALCTELHRLLQLFLTIPVATASSERSFSVLRRLKNYLRASMTQERLNHVLLLHCLKSRTDNIDLNQIAKTFISSNDRRSTTNIS